MEPMPADITKLVKNTIMKYATDHTESGFDYKCTQTSHDKVTITITAKNKQAEKIIINHLREIGDGFVQ